MLGLNVSWNSVLLVAGMARFQDLLLEIKRKLGIKFAHGLFCLQSYIQRGQIKCVISDHKEYFAMYRKFPTADTDQGRETQEYILSRHWWIQTFNSQSAHNI